jgi:hypothetical protein
MHKNNFYKIFTFLGLFHILINSCCSPSIEAEKNVDLDTIVAIARSRSCDCQAGTFDACIFKIQPHFDKLSEPEQNIVALNFVLYGELDAGSRFAFVLLIDPYHDRIIRFLENVKDSELQANFSRTKKEIDDYRRSVDIYSTAREKRQIHSKE